jgi:hypothetical protein
MIETGDGAAAYYADIMQAVLTLAVTAPGGPPVNAAGFLDRLDARWLKNAWSDGRHPAEVARVQSAARHLPDIQLRFATLLDRLGPALDGPGTLADADAWYFILEGTGEPSVADAQAMAITELAAHAAINPGCEPRAILLAADDYSAASRRVPLSNLYERGRSLGIGLQVSAQSWQGLGRDDDERYRIAATADGGIFVLHTPYPEPLIQLAGTRRVLETAHKLIGNTWQAIADQTHPGREDGGNLRKPASKPNSRPSPKPHPYPPATSPSSTNCPTPPDSSPRHPTTCANASPPRSPCKPSTGQTPARPPSSSPSPTPFPPPSTPSSPTPASTTTPQPPGHHKPQALPPAKMRP